MFEDVMGVALEQAQEALASGDVPVGAVVIDRHGAVVAVAHNEREQTGDPTAHAEVLALRRAAEALNEAERGDGWRLQGCTLVVTLEPCVMCAGAVVAARIERVVFGAWDEKAGAAGSVWDMLRDNRANHQVEGLGGVRAAECASLLTDFFAHRR
jgi:tRNA(adenine34) deaminase